MKEKKIIKDWKIAAIHTGIGGLVVPYIFSIVYSFAYAAIFFSINPSLRTLDSYSSAIFIISEFFLALFVWFGAYISSKIINRSFIIENKKNVIGLATVFYFSIEFIFLGWSLIIGDWIEGIANLLIATGIFYFSSLIHIKSSEQQILASEDSEIFPVKTSPTVSAEEKSIAGWKMFFMAIFSIITIHLVFHSFFFYQSNKIRNYADEVALDRAVKMNPEIFSSDNYIFFGKNPNPYYIYHYFPKRECYIEPIKNTQFYIRGNTSIDEFVCSTLFSFPPILGYLPAIFFAYFFFLCALFVSRVKNYYNFYRLSKYVLIAYTGILLIAGFYVWLTYQIASNMQIL